MTVVSAYLVTRVQYPDQSSAFPNNLVVTPLANNGVWGALTYLDAD